MDRYKQEEIKDDKNRVYYISDWHAVFLKNRGNRIYRSYQFPYAAPAWWIVYFPASLHASLLQLYFIYLLNTVLLKAYYVDCSLVG
jgi:hypothetical protein